MSEELQAGSGAGVQETPATGAPGVASEEQGGAGTIPPDIAAAIKEQVAAALADVRRKYEGPEGDIAKTKSTYDKLLAEERRKLEELRKSKLQEAERLAQRDPARAYRLQREVVSDLTRQSEIEQQAQRWGEWVSEQYQAAGLDLEEPEIAAEATDAVQRLLDSAMRGEGPEMALAFQRHVADKGLEAERKKTARATRELEEVRGSIPGLVKEQVARTLAELGMSTPDSARPRSKRIQKDGENWRHLSPDQQIRYGIEQGRKEVPLPGDK